jgi:hypothetical protein
MIPVQAMMEHICVLAARLPQRTWGWNVHPSSSRARRQATGSRVGSSTLGEPWSSAWRPGGRSTPGSMGVGDSERSWSAGRRADQSANGETLKVHASPSGCARLPECDLKGQARAEVQTLGLAEQYSVQLFVPPIAGSDHWPSFVAGVPDFYALWDPVAGYDRSGDAVEAFTRGDKYEAVVGLMQGVLGRLGADERGTNV